jgi:hypothetical protein
MRKKIDSHLLELDTQLVEKEQRARNAKPQQRHHSSGLIDNNRHAK